MTHLDNKYYSSNIPAPDDQEVWINLRGGDEKALNYLYSKYFKMLYNYGCRFSVNVAIAEDSIQEMFIEFWSKRETIVEVRNTKHYLFKCLRRRIERKLIVQNRLPSKDLDQFELSVTHKSHYLSHQIDKEIRERVTALVHSLPAKEKEAIFLIYYEGLSYKEVASIMSLKIKTVYNLINLAIGRLKGNRDTLVNPFILFFF